MLPLRNVFVTNMRYNTTEKQEMKLNSLAERGMSMAIMSFEAHVRHQPRAAIVDLQGEINALAERVLITAFDEAASQQPELILLNFRQVEYINSTGIALIVELLKRARKIKCPLLACGLSEHYTEIFRISRLTDFIGVFPDEASALQKNHITHVD